MKKILIIITLLFTLTSCTKKPNDPIDLDDTLDINISTYKDDNPIKVGLYVDEYLSKEYTTTKTNMQDITVFNIYYTNKEKLENNFNIEVIMEDERLTSVISNNVLIEADLSRKKRKQKVDGIAAEIILQGYLDRKGE